mgnify:CR=1 FL=1
MAKTIITQDGSAVNYDNILAVYTYDGVESEMPSEEAASYLLSADTVTDVTYVLGEYKTAEETEKAKSELIAWLQREAFGVYSMAENKGEV